MGSGFDDVAKAVATGMPRRKVFRLLAGGVAAAIGATVMGRSASANGGSTSSSFFWPGVNQTIYINRPVAGRDLGLNRQFRQLFEEPVLNQGPPINQGPPFINGTY
jgi:hypothetical protein